MKKLLTVFAMLATSFAVEPASAAASATLETAPTRFVDAGGIHFAYREIGNEPGVPLVLLQHFTGTMDYWGPAVVNALAKAIIVFSSSQDPSNKLLGAIHQPVLIVTGSNDTMLPSESSHTMFKLPKNAQLVMYPDSSHGAPFQYHERFSTEVNHFLNY